jgi:signal transduction histidine kinase
MTSFDSPFDQAQPDDLTDPPVRKPRRWALANWPVGWKVFAIAVVPLALAGTLGGLRIHDGWTQASALQLAADRADMVPAIENYMATLDGALLANSTGGDTQAANAAFNTSKSALQDRLGSTDVAADVRSGVRTILGGGQGLLDKVAAGGLGLRERVTGYAPILLTAEDAITGSVRVGDEKTRAQAQGLSRAVGARGQMMMQQLLINQGGELPDAELRNSMTTLAGTEPSTLFGMSELLGVGSPDAQKLAQEMVKRMAMMSDPGVVLVNNPDLTQSIATTSSIAGKLIAGTAKSVTSAVDDQAAAKRSAAVRDSVIVTAAMLLALLLVLLVARSLVRPLRRLRDGALKVAHQDLVRELDAMRAGGDPPTVRPLPVYTTEEVGQVAHAVDELHEQAVLLAGEQSRLQLQVGDMFETLSRRNRSLVDQQLSVIDQLERDEQDPQRLDSLFRLDHLATRMRRNGANLLVLAGADTPRGQAGSVPVAAIINAAASEVEDYTRVITSAVPDTEVHGSAAGDLVHLLAELLDNALRNSPPGSQVQVSAGHASDGALAIDVADTGLGMTDADLRMANLRMRSGGEIDAYTARHMGLFVVGRLAARQTIEVRLRGAESGSGTTADIRVPYPLLVGGPEPLQHWDADPNAGVQTDPELDTDHQGFTAIAEPDVHDVPASAPVPTAGADHLAEPADLSGLDLPQRNPGSSGIVESPTTASAPANTATFFSSRARAAEESAPPLASQAAPQSVPPLALQPEPAAERPPVSANAGSEDAIFQKMLSEWLIDDPTELAHSTDLDWKSVWDHGWSAAAAAEQAPVAEHTEEGLPVRQPGARLVPGAPDEDADEATTDDEPVRDPEAVRSSFSSHFGGVEAARSQAKHSGSEQ